MMRKEMVMRLYSMAESALSALGESPSCMQIARADLLSERYYPNLSTDRPALIGPLNGQKQVQRIVDLLLLAYPAEHGVVLLWRFDQAQVAKRHLSLVEARALEPGADALLYLPPLSCPGTVETFMDTVAHLRSPDGCPWDREQTHRSLRQGFQEEAYEVLDALDQGDIELLSEELGDILLHVLLQAQIAIESGEFRLSDVVCRVNTKLVHRHPHVFKGLEVEGVEEILVNWEELKQQEKEHRAVQPSSLDGVSPSMPALARAQSILRHIDRREADVPSPQELRQRICSQLAALPLGTDRQVQALTLGELLFELASLGRLLHVDLEGALREANSRFERAYREQEGTLGTG
jgi:tetrapyrrole methylase family protein/MazG family protein